MEAMFGFLYTFLVKYLIPFIFAIGLIMFLYGSVNYFVIGPGEEPKKEEGRMQLLWAFILFGVGLLIYALVAGLVWLGNYVVTLGDHVEVGEEQRLQRVPDVPVQNN